MVLFVKYISTKLGEKTKAASKTTTNDGNWKRPTGMS